MQGAKAGKQGNRTDSLIHPLNFASLCLRWIGGRGNRVGSGMGKFGMGKVGSGTGKQGKFALGQGLSVRLRLFGMGKFGLSKRSCRMCKKTCVFYGLLVINLVGFFCEIV